MADPIRIQSDLLKGLTRDHSDDKEAATLRSTGFMEFEGGRSENPKNWHIEYVCDTCKQTALVWSADTNDMIRDVLKEKGILNAEGLPADGLAA